MYREQPKITEKLIKYACKICKKSEYFTRLKSLSQTELEFEVDFIGTKYEKFGLKSLYLKGNLDDNDEIKVYYLEYDIDISYLMFYDKTLLNISVFNITSLNGLSKLVNEELELIFDKNVNLLCKSDTSISVYSNLVVIDDKLNLEFMNKLESLYNANISLKGSLLIKQSNKDKLMDNLSYIDNLFNHMDFLLKYTDIDEYILDLRYYDKNNIYYMLHDSKDKNSIADYLINYLNEYIDSICFNDKMFIRVLLSELSFSDIDKLVDKLDNIESKNKNLAVYISKSDMCVSVKDYIKYYNEYLKVNRKKFDKIHIM